MDSIEYNIHSKKEWGRIIFLSIWVIFWGFSEFNLIDRILNEYMTTLVYLSYSIGIIMWTFGGVMTLISLLWLIAGLETVHVSSGKLIIEKKLFWITTTRTYDIEEIKYLTINLNLFKDQWGGKFTINPFKNGLIEFDYGLETIKFCFGERVVARKLMNNFRSNPNFKETNFR